MNPQTFSTRLRWRWALIGFGIALLVWLPFEDTTEKLAVGLAAAGSALVWRRLVLMILRRWPDARLLLVAAAAGLACGLAVSPFSLGLMILKSGLHLHAAPEYTPAQLFRVGSLLPLWGVAGSLLGLGYGMLLENRSPRQPKS